MRARFLYFIFTLLLFSSLGASAQRRVNVRIEGLFSFEPLYGYYEKESLESIATYIEAWRQEDSTTTLYIKDSLSWGYRHYLAKVDTTLLPRVYEYLDAKTIPTSDTILYMYKDLSDFPLCRDFTEHFNSDIQGIKRYFATPLCNFDTLLRYDPYHGNDFESLFHTFQCDVTGADLSLFAPSRLNASLPQECYIKDITSLLYYDNTLVTVELTGSELKKIMEESYARRFYRPRSTKDDLLKHRVPSYLHTSIGGINHTVNLTKPKGRTIENWELDPDKKYLVAMNSFMARDLEIIEDFGDYKNPIIEWLRTSKDYFRVKVLSTLQPQRILKTIEERERKTIFSKENE